MNEKEIAELRRRFRPEKSNITHIRGCFVNDKRKIVSQFDQSLALMAPEETEELLAVLRRTLSGALGKNLIDIPFDTDQVVSGDEHSLLMKMRDSSLADEDAVQTFFERVVQSLSLETHYMILLAHDTYDVPYRSTDGARQDDASSAVFSYILCSICPVKTTKPALSYYISENKFYNCTIDWLISPPELGFLFPAFDDRCANLYNALYYTRNTAESHQDFVDAVFCQPLPMPAAEQKEAFESLLSDTLAEECNLELLQSVHEQLSERIAEHKEAKDPTPLTLPKHEASQLLASCGVSSERVEAFAARYDETFGEDAALPVRNVVDTKQFQVSTPDVTIQVNPERSDLVQTRVIDGAQYILVRVEEGVEVNGVSIQLQKPAAEHSENETYTQAVEYRPVDGDGGIDQNKASAM